MKYNRGFTVVEIVVVVAIIGILASVVIFNAVAGSTRSRDVDRQADLKTVQAAIELYKQKYGRYPAGCNNPGTWSGQPGTIYACPSGHQYITGHVDTTDWDRDGNVTEQFSFAPEFIPVLPIDKKLPDTNAGYVYAVNTAGTVYKLAARRTVEADTLSYSHPLRSCDVSTNTAQTTNVAYTTAPLCNRLISTGLKPSHCEATNSTFLSSYAVWGGNAAGTGTGAGSSVDNTEDIVCL